MQTNKPNNNPLAFLERKKILVVEDEISNYELLVAMLRKSGVEFSWARNGIEAIELYDSNHFDLILMDIKMPEMSGYEAVNKIRSQDQEIPIIAQTAYARIEDEMIILKKGFNGYISKPIDKTKLIRILEKILQNSK